LYPERTFSDGRYYPARRLLEISTTEFKDIMDENAHVWDDGDIPQHIRDFQRWRPGEVVDPDWPPQDGVVRAIRWLKQEHFPGSLLGEWQFPLPDLEVFRPPVMFPAKLKLRLGHDGAL
jgi:hypothetical protein